MDGFRLSEDELEERAAEGSFERGVEYHEAKAVLSVIARGKHVQARVSGSRAQPYQVELAGADGDELGRVSCSCPDDREGWCKHVVAVLLAIRGGDEELEQRPTPEVEIGELSEGELRSFVEELAISRSEVLDLLEARWETVRVLEADEAATEDFDAGPFRRRVLMLLHGGQAGTGYTYARAIRTKEGITELVELTDRLTCEGAPAAAAEALAVMLDVYLEGWEKIHGLGRFPGDVVESLAEGLEEALERMGLSEDETDRWLSRIDEWQEAVEGYGLRRGFLGPRHAVQAGVDVPRS
ncbi:hypothetical protein BRD56_06930 [Thermoplasmatales archaeon SW_10_69_26]|nr:MAG: hypothetical protein BRD56_06930 [Thermoplasmatales archaeon SW_10_69_26]